jgi:8-oxo-dGTP diphosphatase
MIQQNILIVTVGIIRVENSVLLTRRPEESRHAGKWEFPGGKLEDGESPTECLHRELLEELDLDVQVGAIYDVIHHLYDFGPILLLTYECTPLSKTIRNLQVAEHRFVPLNQLDHYDMLPADLPLIRKLMAETSA